MSEGQRWQRVKQTFDAAAGSQGDDRAARVRQLCGDDQVLRAEVESLLSADTRRGSVFERPGDHGLREQVFDAVAGVLENRIPMLTPGDQLGSYEITGFLGAGGMGRVYRARDTTLGRDVALKMLPALWLADPDRRARFEREARLLATLNHPNIGAIYGVHESGGIRALVLELVEGETLAERVENTARSTPSAPGLPVTEALAIARQIAEALDAAHERGVVHRDLKPANIKITPEERVKVLDFGLATATGSESAPGLTQSPTISIAHTHDGVLLGTAPYMSPEQARGKSVDKRSDIWVFGCVLYEILTGKRAFEGENVSETLSNVLQGEPDFGALPVNTPASVRRLLSRCLEKDRSKRLTQIAIAAFQIEETLAEDRADIDAVADYNDRQQPKRAVALGFVAGIVGALAVATVVWWGTSRDAASLSPVTRLLMGVAPATQIGGNEGRPDRTAMAISPDGRTLVFSAMRANRRSLYVRAFDEAEAAPIPGTDDGIGPFFSPDGQWVGYWSAGEIRKVPLAGGPPVRITEVPQVFGATWGDDDRIVFGRAGGGLWEVPTAGGTPVSLTVVNREQGEVSHRLPHALPGGDTILFTVTKNRFPRWDQTQISAYSRATRLTKVIVEGGADARYVETGHLIYLREGVAFAAPFDRQRVEVTGGSVGVVANVMQSAYHRGAFSDTGAAQLTISAAGTLVYVPGGVVTAAERSVVSVDREGRPEPLPIARHAFATLRLSPDGQRIALSTFGRDRDVWLFALAQGTLTKLPAPGRNGVPIWTPDGQWLTYTSGTGGPDNLRRVRADGGGSPEPLLDSEQSLVPGTWTPDGRQLFYDTIPAADASLNSTWSWNAVGNIPPTAIVGVSTNGGGIDLSPDGRWIAYQSDNAGRLEVYVQAHPGPGPRHQVSTAGGISPVWRGDGRELFYVEPSVPPDTANSARLNSGAIRIMSVPVQLEPSLTLGAPRRLFEGRYQVNMPARGYDVTADGQRFVLLQEEERVPDVITHMMVVQNWLEELKQRVPTR